MSVKRIKFTASNQILCTVNVYQFMSLKIQRQWMGKDNRQLCTWSYREFCEFTVTGKLYCENKTMKVYVKGV